MGLLRGDLDAFGHEFSLEGDGSGYYHTEILHEIDAAEFAEVVFGHVTSGNFEAVGAQLQTLADRHRPGDNFPEEIVWAEKVKIKLEQLAEKAGTLEKARMVWFLRFTWKFPTPPEADA